ncbi:alpha-L-arabinofuranosidase C-terminal domain-containing protein [Streptomyces canus]|uniref:alpha-L-arabinofuranosidase C-terminal domain-containing protein n=1 Tax=Streptomyces canus TaxID=58343 RepID=UPI003695034D
MTSRLAAGEVIRPVVEAPPYTTARHGEAALVDAVATVDEDRAAVDVRSLASARILEAVTLADKDAYAKNTLTEQNRVTPYANPSASLSDGLLSIELPPVSWTAIALG